MFKLWQGLCNKLFYFERLNSVLLIFPTPNTTSCVYDIFNIYIYNICYVSLPDILSALLHHPLYPKRLTWFILVITFVSFALDCCRIGSTGTHGMILEGEVSIFIWLPVSFLAHQWELFFTGRWQTSQGKIKQKQNSLLQHSITMSRGRSYILWFHYILPHIFTSSLITLFWFECAHYLYWVFGG